MNTVDWTGCYDGSWQSAPLVAEAYALYAVVPVFSCHVAPVTQCNQVRARRCIRFALEQSCWNDVMHVKFLASGFLRHAAIRALVTLFKPDLLSYDTPSLTVRRPSTLPRGIVFKRPVSRFPLAKTSAITEESHLSALCTLSELPRWNSFRLPAICAFNLGKFRALRPSHITRVFSYALRGAENFISHSRWYYFNFLPALRAIHFNPSFLARWTARRNIPRSARHRAEAAILGWNVQCIRLNGKGFAASSTVDGGAF